MLFSSMTFIFVFLPIVLLTYLSTKKELHNPILLIASIIFYAWSEPKYLAIMLSVIIINYFSTCAIEKYQKNKKFILVLAIAANLSFLIYFKYFNFIIASINSIFHLNINILNIVLPIGISFYIFQAMSYVIDVFRGEVKAQKDIYKLALYICLFPQLIAGPIVKYHDIKDQLESREVNFEKVNIGVKRFIVGLSKKILIANTMGQLADAIFSYDPYDISTVTSWLGAFAYSLQLYFDFSGYSDMAIGLGMIFGFKFMENFNYPYISKSITEFWRRWHISLSTWFKQYVYISIGGNKKGKTKTIRNLAIVFLLTGIWHGANWTFIVWGIWHGAFIIFEKIINIKEIDKKDYNLCIKILRHIYCVFIFVIGWVIFRSDNLKYAFNYLIRMFNLVPARTMNIIPVDKMQITIFIIALICSVPLFKNMLQVKNVYCKFVVNIWLLILFFLSTISIASSTYNPFIYFRF